MDLTWKPMREATSIGWFVFGEHPLWLPIAPAGAWEMAQ